MKQQAIYAISFEAIDKLLGLDPEHHVVGVDTSDNYKCFENNTFVVKIIGPKLPKVPEGSPTPWVNLNAISATDK